MFAPKDVCGSLPLLPHTDCCHVSGRLGDSGTLLYASGYLFPPDYRNQGRYFLSLYTAFRLMGFGYIWLFRLHFGYVVYRGVNKGLHVFLSRTQGGPGRTVKQEQEEISRKHVQTFIYLSVEYSISCTKIGLINLRQMDLKASIAYSSVAHLGVVIIAFSSGSVLSFIVGLFIIQGFY